MVMTSLKSVWQAVNDNELILLKHLHVSCLTDISNCRYAPLSWRIRRYPCPWFWISCLCESPRPGTPRRTACRRGSGREPWKIHPPLSWGWEMCLVCSFVDWISSLEFNSGNSIFTVGHLQKKVFLVPSVCFHFLFSPL